MKILNSNSICFSASLIFTLIFSFTCFAQDQQKSKLVTNQEWIDFVKANAKPISLDTTGDYSDLQFLIPILKDKRIVMLGESSHGTREFTDVKIRLIKFLHEQMGYNVIALESQLELLESQSALSPLQLMTQYMSDSRFYTQEMLELFKYQNSRDNFWITGFDNRFFYTKNIQQLDSLLKPLNNKTKALARHSDSLALAYINMCLSKKKKCNIDQANEVKNNAIKSYNLLIDNLNKESIFYSIQSKKQLLVNRLLRNRIRYVEAYKFGESNKEIYKEYHHYNRELFMTQDLTWITETLFPDEKIIVWAHNGHISKDYNKGRLVQTEKIMGAELPNTINGKAYVVGIYMYSGQTGVGTSKGYQVRKPLKNSLEAILHSSEQENCMLDISLQEKNEMNEWLFKEIETLYWGGTIEKLNLSKTYDGIILIGKTSRSRVLPAPNDNHK